MILVEWKGDDERPYRLSFHPHLTVVRVERMVRQHLVRDLAAAFSHVQPQDDGPEEASEIQVLRNASLTNVLQASDVDWLLGQVTPGESSEASESSDELWTRLTDEAQDEVGALEERIAALQSEMADLAGENVLHEDSRRLDEASTESAALQDAVDAADLDFSLPQNASELLGRLVQLLEWRINAITVALTLRVADPTAVEAALETLRGQETWSEQQRWVPVLQRLRELSAEEQHFQTSRRPPEWLLEQSRIEFEEATASLAVFSPMDDHDRELALSDQAIREQNQMELAVRKRYIEAEAVWHELQGYLDTNFDERRLEIDALLDQVAAMSALAPANAAEAMTILEAHLTSLTTPAHDETLLLAALANEGVLPPDDDVATFAESWIARRRQELETQAKQRRELAILQCDLASVQAFADKAAQLETHASELATSRLAAADVHRQQRQVLLSAELDQARARASYLARQASTSTPELLDDDRTALAVEAHATTGLLVSTTISQRLRHHVQFLQEETSGEAIPLIMDAVLDGLDGDSQLEILEAMLAVSGSQQIICFTEDDSVVQWAEGQSAEMVAVASVTLQ